MVRPPKGPLGAFCREQGEPWIGAAGYWAGSSRHACSPRGAQASRSRRLREAPRSRPPVGWSGSAGGLVRRAWAIPRPRKATSAATRTGWRKVADARVMKSSCCEVERRLARAPSVFPIPKASSAEHAGENAAAGNLTLSAVEISAIDKAFPRGPKPRGLPML